MYPRTWDSKSKRFKQARTENKEIYQAVPPGFLFSNFPGSRLLFEGTGKNYLGHKYTERALTGQQGFFEQPEIFEQPQSYGQFGISEQLGFIGHAV